MWAARRLTARGERKAAIAALPEPDREAVWTVELEQSEGSIPVGYEDLGAGE